MLSDKNNVIGFIIIIAFLGALISTSHKYYLQKIGVEAVTIIDVIFTSIVVIFLTLMAKPKNKILKDINQLTKIDWIIFLITSIALGFSIIIGRQLLLHNDLGDLAVLDGGVDIILTTFVSYLFYKEIITIQKAIGIILVLAGMFVLN